MTKRVFITGATGYIGSHVAQAFREAGYRVAGLTRSRAGAARLEAAGIEAVIGSMQAAGDWREAAAGAAVLVHAAVDYTADTFALDRETVDTLLAIRAETGARFLYTSGVWVAGNSHGAVLDESASQPIELVRARAGIESRVTEAGGIVLRPGVVYGERGGLTGPWFAGEAVVGDGANHWAMVNAEDLGRGYVLAAENATDSELFHLVDDSRFTVAELVDAARTAAGVARPVEWIPFEIAVEQLGPFAEALTIDQVVANDKARSVLGWQPRQPDFVSGAKRYFDEWREVQRQAA